MAIDHLPRISPKKPSNSSRTDQRLGKTPTAAPELAGFAIGLLASRRNLVERVPDFGFDTGDEVLGKRDAGAGLLTTADDLPSRSQRVGSRRQSSADPPDVDHVLVVVIVVVIVVDIVIVIVIVIVVVIIIVIEHPWCDGVPRKRRKHSLEDICELVVTVVRVDDVADPRPEGAYEQLLAGLLDQDDRCLGGGVTQSIRQVEGVLSRHVGPDDHDRGSRGLDCRDARVQVGAFAELAPDTYGDGGKTADGELDLSLDQLARGDDKDAGPEATRTSLPVVRHGLDRHVAAPLTTRARLGDRSGAPQHSSHRQ
jgi:hypothetical protein